MKLTQVVTINPNKRIEEVLVNLSKISGFDEALFFIVQHNGMAMPNGELIKSIRENVLPLLKR